MKNKRIMHKICTHCSSRYLQRNNLKTKCIHTCNLSYKDNRYSLLKTDRISLRLTVLVRLKIDFHFLQDQYNHLPIA